MKTRSLTRWVLAASTAMLVAGCNTTAHGATDKAGSDSIVLHLASVDLIKSNSQSFGSQAFVDQLTKVSGGHIRVEMTTRYGDGSGDAEVRLLKEIAAGTIDGGWPATRAFANAGIPGLRSVEAPMTLTNYPAVKELVSSPVADDILSHLKGTGVVGLGLGVGPLRRPFAAGKPLLALSDWKGIRFRSFDSSVQDAAIRAAGGTPVVAGDNWVDSVAAGEMDGLEFDIIQYDENGMTTEAGMVTSNVVLWPKVQVFSLSQKRYDSLNAQQRAWVHTAAQLATQASVDGTYDESTSARKLCTSGARFVPATNDQVTAIKTAFAAVIADLAADPLEGPVLAKIQKIAANHTNVETPDVPATCQSISHDTTVTTTSELQETSNLPSGTYRVVISLDDVTKAGISNDNGFTGTWTLTVDSGIYHIDCAPLDNPGVDCGNSPPASTVEAGRLIGTGNSVTFQSDADLMHKYQGCQLPESRTPGHCLTQPAYTMTWASDGKALTFTASGSSKLDENLLLKPLIKIG